MNIYYCKRRVCGYIMTAIVSAKSGEYAIKLLDWHIDKDTKDISALYIGNSHYDETKVWTEDAL